MRARKEWEKRRGEEGKGRELEEEEVPVRRREKEDRGKWKDDDGVCSLSNCSPALLVAGARRPEGLRGRWRKKNKTSRRRCSK